MPDTRRFDVLSQSESGLTFVRERRGGVTRVLTPGELADFADPRPCPECAEQFGCDHFNCAGETMLADSELEATVPRAWQAFAREHGVSREDLARLASLEQHDGAFRVKPGAPSDMRTLELVLLRNDV